MPEFHHATAPSLDRIAAQLERPAVWIGLASLSFVVAALALGVAPGPLMLAAALPLLAILCAVAATRPEWVLFLFVAYIPFDSSRFRPIDLPADLSVAKLLGAALLVSFLFAVVFRGAPLRLFDNGLDLWVASLAMLMMFSIVVSILPAQSLAALSRMARLFVLYVAVKNLIETREQIRRILWIVLLSGTAGALYGIVHFYQARAYRIHDIRVGGVFMDPNDFAISMIVVLAVGVHLLHLHDGPRIRTVIAACLAVCGCAFLLSGSRGGVVSLFVVAGVYIWRHPQRYRLLAATVLLVALSIPLWPDSVRDRFLGPLIADHESSVYVETANHSSKRRLSYVTFGLSLVAERPFFGYGYDTFELLNPRSEFARFDNPMEDRQRYRPAHNGYLENAVGMGLPGLLAFAGTLGFGWFLLRRFSLRAGEDREFRAMAQALELAMLGILVGNLFLSIEHSKYLWLILGIAAAMTRSSPAVAGQPDGTA